MRKSLVIGLLILLLTGCRTTTPAAPILPEDLPVVELTGDDNIDITNLLIQDVRWRLLVLNIRWITGSLSEEEYEEKTATLLKILGV